MIDEFAGFIIVFFFYSFIGYLLEVISVSLHDDQMVLSRGYLIGPYLPIFGFGSLFMISFLDHYKEDIVALFILGLVSCCILEYFTSLLMEKIFKLRWWDYSDKKFNINGRVCLENGIYFGIGSVLLIRYIHPWLVTIISSFPTTFIIILGLTLFFILLCDFIVSTYLTLELKNDVYDYMKKDSTSVIKKKLKSKLGEESILRNRILRAYPKLKEGSSMIEIYELFKKKR